MPIYDYICSNCRHRTEVIHGINDTGPRFCPNCGAEGTMTKGFSTPAVHFKGSGWAKKDRSANSTRTKAAAAGASGSGSDGAPASSSGDGNAGSSSSGDAGASSSKDTPKPAPSSED